MDIFEFELRYLAYKGMNRIFDMQRDQETILNLVKITNGGKLNKKVQDIAPEELKSITLETYTKFKKDLLTQVKSKKTDTKYLESIKILFTEAESLDTYINRLEYELKVIKEMGFNTYFLIVSDFVSRAKDSGIVVGPGRGSGAGSLLARLIRITDIDPLPYGLLFERFLNPARVSMPDFDIDFEDQHREKVIEYVIKKYGKKNVSSIGTFMQLAKKAAFKDVARVLGVNFEKSNKFSSMMTPKDSVLDLIEGNDHEEMKTLYNNDINIQKSVELGERLEGNMRQLGIHACGVIIAPDEIDNFAPTAYIREDDETIVTQYDGYILETIGLLKMDFLGLRNLSVIKNCIKIIKARYDKKGDKLPKIFQDFFETSTFMPPLDDKLTYESIFKKGDTTGIFQFESRGMRSFLVKLKASKINDLIAMNALYRPGPMEFIPSYINRKHGEENVTYLPKELNNILTSKYTDEIAIEEGKKLEEDLGPIMDVTYGIAVFQEQLMFMVQAMAGFSLAEADLLRRGVGKKKKEIIDKIKKDFIKKGKEYRNYKKETTRYIYEKMIEPAASYSFNKSHSVCYSRIAFQTAYLKAHYPVEFYAALIRSVEDNTDDLSNYIKESENHGIIVKAPDINESFNHVAAIDDYIRLGFFCTKGIGLDIGEFIQQERQENGNYKDLSDFLTRCEKIINKKSLESLTKSGALDTFVDRKTILKNIAQILERVKGTKTMNTGLFGNEIVSQLKFEKEYKSSFAEKLLWEQESFKTFMSVHPLDGLYNYLKKNTFLSQIQDEQSIGPFKIIGFISEIQRARRKGFFIRIEDISGQREIFVKNTYGLQRFDIVIIQGYKKEGRYINPNKIIKTSRDKLIELAGNNYNEEITAVIAKKMRMEKTLKESISIIIDDSGKNNIINENTTSEEGTQAPSHTEKEMPNFYLPDNIENINKIRAILIQHKGNISIQIGALECFVNKTGLDNIQSILK